MLTILKKKPELLAPAGGIESFHAAIDRGADAVYLGLIDFNARLRAKNFTVKTLSYLVPYAHAKQRKVYVTLNTLVKQAELEKLIHILYQLDQIGVDGLIVQDLGLIDLCSKAFPRLRLHASTQMSIHNSLGVAAARKLGLSRVVLARELTLDEIALIGRRGDTELEVFVHGALCYSFSGMCLASSFLGGSSGNRGLCTQVCRRPFATDTGKGSFFSPFDLCALAYVPRYCEIGISSLKIEGRMKNAEYVAAVVSAYREAIDNPASIERLLTTIDRDLGRSKTTLFLGGLQTGKSIDPAAMSGTGQFLGRIESVNEAEIVVRGNHRISKGDVVRIQPVSGFEGRSAPVAAARGEGARCRILLKDRIACGAGDAVYLTRHWTPRGAGLRNHDMPARSVPYKEQYPRARDLLGRYGIVRETGKTDAPSRLLVKIDDPAWLDLLDWQGIDAIVLSLEKEHLRAFTADAPQQAAWAAKIIVAMPPFIAETEIGEWKNIARDLLHQGHHRIMCGNLGQWRLFDRQVKVYGDCLLWSFNRAAQQSLREMGVSPFSYSMEDDYPNMSACASSQGIAYIYGRVALFVSRMQPASPPGAKLRDALENGFLIANKHGLHYLVAQSPLCLFQKRKKMEDAGIHSFIIDLSFHKPDKPFAEELLDQYKQGIKAPGSSMFNFKAGIK